MLSSSSTSHAPQWYGKIMPAALNPNPSGRTALRPEVDVDASASVEVVVPLVEARRAETGSRRGSACLPGREDLAEGTGCGAERATTDASIAAARARVQHARLPRSEPLVAFECYFDFVRDCDVVRVSEKEHRSTCHLRHSRTAPCLDRVEVHGWPDSHWYCLSRALRRWNRRLVQSRRRRQGTSPARITSSQKGHLIARGSVAPWLTAPPPPLSSQAGGGVAGKVAVAAGASAAGYTAVTAPTVKKSELPKKPPTTA